MRPFMQRKIDALHAEIERLVAVEKAWHDKHHPDENKMWRQVEHAAIEVDAWPRRMRRGVQLQGPAQGATT